MTEEVVHGLAESLSRTQLKIVFAESCTGGLVSAALAGVPGISEWLCGSAVTYRSATKVAWLGVDAEKIAQHSAVCPEVALQMALGVLEKTPEADLALSITGHLGPGAPEGMDGLVFVAIARRRENESPATDVVRRVLASADRLLRQREAASLVMLTALERM
ncbi:nicotinamide-nucleotide amidohydrolase family protein [bacterium]|jgi:nicotinamide-nucleotide amidase|nr:nicotinamide-nucleotide amidohydrolase family protein [bacterium]